MKGCQREGGGGGAVAHLPNQPSSTCLTIDGGKNGVAEISGTFRFKYFENPILSEGAGGLPRPEIKLAPPPKDPPLERPRKELRTKNVSVQTQYRDSEAQTDPYSPEYVIVHDGDGDSNDDNGTSLPEVLSLEHLTCRNGELPATEREIARIERGRERKEQEAALPPITDEATLNAHRQFLKEQETKEFDLREKEIDDMMAVRLDTFKRSLFEKDQESEFVTEHRIEVRKKAPSFSPLHPLSSKTLFFRDCFGCYVLLVKPVRPIFYFSLFSKRLFGGKRWDSATRKWTRSERSESNHSATPRKRRRLTLVSRARHSMILL